ncbi:hypothetical protein [Acidipropionibacterium virtanenii]|uniref:hypothetical protein n=1 Tax=Acidipropionibacterium virtanenii TaxID=2057246 RepID=UPI000DECA274|nr:hypothetical protein [Acidipropionibacterium virtanenii]
MDDSDADAFSWSSPEDLRRVFEDRQRPRKGLMAGTTLLTCLWVVPAWHMLAAAGPLLQLPGSVGAVVGLGVLQIAALFTIAGIRSSIDSRFRKRILELRRSASLTPGSARG